MMSEQFEKVGEGLLVRAPGKINLSLLVKGKRPDGFHNIESIMAKIDLYDEILIKQKTEDGGQRTEERTKNTEQRMQNIELICKGEYKVPEGEDNLVYKAAVEILKIKNQKSNSNEERNTGLKITLTKNMPAGSGLGSGSSDAAATLLGINKFFGMGLGKKELRSLAAKLGSDVAFFLDGPIAFCTGRGEKVKKLEKCEFRVFLIVPDVSVSTKRVYENYRHDESRYRRLREEINIYIEKKRLDLISGLCANILEESCFALHPELGVLKKRIESLGIRPVCLSGSGSSMFVFINDANRERAETYRNRIERELECTSFIVNNNSW
ncbi:MAG: 4-(cytidine 5'-diphospho)-2-C-methyl-D-erythritol kinase [Sedimentisphaerales bacterium]|nr:4-(cytidine 5'-diphospho)-2-C-methyl-D-erythritol kinase [Sedimentisphaerales bacterium]